MYFVNIGIKIISYKFVFLNIFFFIWNDSKKLLFIYYIIIKFYSHFNFIHILILFKFIYYISIKEKLNNKYDKI